MRKNKEKHPDKEYHSNKGIDILDFIETYGEESDSLCNINIKQKLHQLKVKFPGNSFYKSLYSQRDKLSKKQIFIIEKDYRVKLNN